jgi:hypothetical protein
VVRRFVIVLLVGFLSASTGGLLDLVAPEACSPSESASAPADGSCPDTCVRCHCARAFDFAVQLDSSTDPLLSPEWMPLVALVPQLLSHDILHVPKPTLG